MAESATKRAKLSDSEPPFPAEKQPLNILVVLGTVRSGRLGSRVGKFVIAELQKRKHNVTLLDPMEVKFPILEKPLHFHGKDEVPAQYLVDWNEKIKAADAIVLISGEYNSTIPPALSNALDHFPPSSYAYKPSAIICYSAGAAGGLRASMHLRDMCAELGCIAIGLAFTIGTAQKALDEEGNPTEPESVLPGRLNRTVTTLEWYAEAMRHQRSAAGLPKL